MLHTACDAQMNKKKHVHWVLKKCGDRFLWVQYVDQRGARCCLIMCVHIEWTYVCVCVCPTYLCVLWGCSGCADAECVCARYCRAHVKRLREQKQEGKKGRKRKLRRSEKIVTHNFLLSLWAVCYWVGNSWSVQWETGEKHAKALMGGMKEKTF